MRLCITFTLAVLAGHYLTLTAWAQETSSIKALEIRTVPVPAGVSEELREMIASREIRGPLPVPNTREEWLELQSSCRLDER